MKKTLFTLIAASLTAFASYAQQIPNSYFDNWNNTEGYNNPDGWGNTNSIMGSKGAYPITKGSNGNPVNSYLKITTVMYDGTLIPGVAVSGNLDASNLMNMKYSGYAFTDRPEKLTGKWQYMAMEAGDQGFIYILLTKWNATTQSRDTIGAAKELLNDMVMEWGDFSIPISYSSSAAPDSAVIVLASSGGGTKFGNYSYLYIDDLAFMGENTGICSYTNVVHDLTIYPVPAKNNLAIDFENTKATQKLSLQLIDLQGRVLLQKAMTENHYNLDISTIAPGSYLLKITDGTQVQSQKVMIVK